MMIKIVTMTPQGEWRQFILRHDLEVVYSVLHTFMLQGETLVSAALMDQQGYMPLPLEAFDKAIFSNPIQALRRQWETLLAQPLPAYRSQEALQQQLINLRQRRLISVHRVISHTQALLEKVVPLPQRIEDDKLLRHYLRILDCYSRLLVKLEISPSLGSLDDTYDPARNAEGGC